MHPTNLDVILSPPEIDLLPRRDLSNSVAVVFDVLRATSTMITALAHGAAGIRPVRTIEEALALREKFPDALLGGERQGDRIEGFDLGNSPLEYAENVRGREIITTTTNGTVALRAVEHAACVLAGSFLNIGAICERLCTQGGGEIMLVCAGTFREAALEDVLAAGMLISGLPGAVLTDSAQVAHALYEQNKCELAAAISQSKNGRALVTKGRQPEVAWCARVSVYPLLAEMTREGVVRKI